MALSKDVTEAFIASRECRRPSRIQLIAYRIGPFGPTGVAPRLIACGMLNHPDKEPSEARIDFRSPMNVERWCRVLGVDERVLRAAVTAVGAKVFDVLRYLDRQGPLA